MVKDIVVVSVAARSPCQHTRPGTGDSGRKKSAIMKFIYRVIILLVLCNALVLLYSIFLKKDLIPGSLNLGWPETYFQRFRLRNSPTDNHGWHVKNFIYDQKFI